MQKRLKSILVYTLPTVYWRKAEIDVTFNSEKGVTDTTGEVQFTTNAGTYNCDIDKLYYQHETGTVSVQSYTTLYFYLTTDTTFYFARNSNPAGMRIISDSRKITTVHDDFYSLEVRDLPPGMYLIEILDHEPLSICRFIKN